MALGFSCMLRIPAWAYFPGQRAGKTALAAGCATSNCDRAFRDYLKEQYSDEKDLLDVLFMEVIRRVDWMPWEVNP